MTGVSGSSTSILSIEQQMSDANTGTATRTRLLGIALYMGWWTVFAFVYANLYYSSAQQRGDPISWGKALGMGFLDMYLWAVLAAVAIVLARHLPLDHGRWQRNIPIHLLLAVALLVGRYLIENLFASITGVLEVRPLAIKIASQIPGHSMAYLSLLGVGFSFDYFRRFREGELHATHLESQLAGAQLQALKMQLHPHFLFNTLNSISVLMHRDVQTAACMLGRLEALLRMTLERAGVQEVSLRDELDLLEPYLEIEQTRFGDRLRVEWALEPEALDAQVPHLILQPLIENAIRHGISPRSAAGRIEITARRVEQMLELEVRDDGAGFPAPSPWGVQGGVASGATHPRPAVHGNGSTAQPTAQRRRGVGLANTRARLAQLYGEHHHFDVARVPDGGTAAQIQIPFRSSQSQHRPTPTHAIGRRDA